MTYPYTEPLFSNFLMVRMSIKREDLGAYKRHMRQVIDRVFGPKLGWKLVRKGIRKKPGDAKQIEILHLAQLPERANLWEGMYSVAADSSFAKVSKLLTSESQELLRLAPLSPVKLAHDSQSKGHFAFSELELEQDWFNLCKWREHLLSLNVQRQTGPAGWPLYATFRPQTGNLRRQINMWQIDKSQEAASINWSSKRNAKSDAKSDFLEDGKTRVVVKRNPIEVYGVIEY